MDNSEQKLKETRAIINQLKEEKKFSEAIKYIEKISESRPADEKLLFERAELLFLAGEINKSYELTFELLKKSPNDINLLKLCVQQQHLFNNHEVKIKIYQRILKILPYDIDSFIGISSSFISIEKFKEAIQYSKRGIEIKNNSEELYNNLILSLILDKDFLKALDMVKNVEKFNPLGTLTASYGVYLNEVLGVKYQFKFLSEPYNYIREYSFSEEGNIKFMKEFYDFILKLPKIWEPKFKTTVNGSQTDNNLFFIHQDNNEIKTFMNFITRAIDEYKQYYKNTEDLYIKEFPDQYALTGWAVNLKTSGYQKSHNHSNSWLSGVFYLKVPSKLSKNDGNIKFSKHGYNFPKSNEVSSSKIIEVNEGKLVMFPSSLYHETIPFESNEDRISIAFDVRKV